MTRQRDTAPANPAPAGGLSFGRMAAVVPVGLAFGWAIPALIDLGAWIGERLSDASRLLLAAAIVGAWAVLARALTRGEVARG